MIHAITRGKVSRSLTHREDVVTSTVFGALRCASTEVGLAGALGALRSEAEGVLLGDLRAYLAHYGFDACRAVRPPTPVEIAWRFARRSTTR